jgi:hypothetical protein
MAQKMNQQQMNKNTPPPLPSRNEVMYHIAVEEKQEGPYDIRAIQGFISEGTVKKETLVWTEGLKDWAEADTIFEEYFSKSTPPPLPKN